MKKFLYFFLTLSYFLIWAGIEEDIKKDIQLIKKEIQVVKNKVYLSITTKTEAIKKLVEKGLIISDNKGELERAYWKMVKFSPNVENLELFYQAGIDINKIDWHTKRDSIFFLFILS